MVLLSLQLEAFVDMAFCAWILGTSPWEVVTQKALLRDPTVSLSLSGTAPQAHTAYCFPPRTATESGPDCLFII